MKTHQFFIPLLKKLIMLVTVAQFISVVVYVVGVANISSGLQEMVEAGDAELSDLPYFTQVSFLLWGLPWLTIIFSLVLICVSWKSIKACLFCAIPLFNTGIGIVFGVLVFSAGIIYVAVDAVGGLCDVYESVQGADQEEGFAEALEGCSKFVEGYRQFLGGSVMLYITIGIQIILSCFRGCTMTTYKSVTTIVRA
eukprot:TRINITY_DN2738_c0_g1_i2.p1 TRINITY_DN2738_c0_g1~~TRINITY_DN2738_c0_g1_i2.p1  ORF type:complete len:196 (-),score=34.71 TRINITY_DN2738_c0_g1_i2:117-704(-)